MQIPFPLVSGLTLTEAELDKAHPQSSFVISGHPVGCFDINLPARLVIWAPLPRPAWGRDPSEEP